MAAILDQASIFLPQWLSADQRGALFEQLQEFPNIPFYDPTAGFLSDLLQGDGWRGFLLIDFETCGKKEVSGVILSNSCDIDEANTHDIEPRIVFAPLIRLERIAGLLRDNQIDEAVIEEKVAAIRAQRVTTMFYLPQLPGVIEESIVMFDDVYGHPSADFMGRTKTKLFTLSQTAFYYFLIKLSIHFTRVREGVHRFLPDPGTPGDAAVAMTSTAP